MTDYQLLQVFISPFGRGVFEVSANSRGDLKCNCPGFSARKVCKHISFVWDRLKANGGEYTIAVPAAMAADLCAQALSSPENYREFVLRYGTVEVL